MPTKILGVTVTSQSSDYKESVRCATTANVDLSTDLAAGQAQDNVTLIAGDRVAVLFQNDSTENGIYVAPATGAAARAADADSSEDVTPGMFFVVEEGDSYSDTEWVLVTDGPVTLGSTALRFEKMAGKRLLLQPVEISEIDKTGPDGSGSNVTHYFRIAAANANRAFTAAGPEASLTIKDDEDLILYFPNLQEAAYAFIYHGTSPGGENEYAEALYGDGQNGINLSDLNFSELAPPPDTQRAAQIDSGSNISPTTLATYAAIAGVFRGGPGNGIATPDVASATTVSGGGVLLEAGAHVRSFQASNEGGIGFSVGVPDATFYGKRKATLAIRIDSPFGIYAWNGTGYDKLAHV